LTISSTNRKAGPFTGDGVATAFPFTFKVFTTADVLVVQAVAATGVETVQALGTDYTIVLNADQNANPGGTITRLVAPPAGTTLTATSQVGNLQPMDLTNAGGFYPKVLNDALDRATVQIQQLAEKLSRALQLVVSTPTGVTVQLPAPVPNNIFGWNATGTAIINYIAQAGTSLVNLAASAGATLIGATGGSWITVQGFISALLSASGASLVGYQPAGAGAIANTVQAELNAQAVNVFRFMTAAQIADVQAGTLLLDISGAIRLAIAYLGTKGLLIFPSGRYRITSSIAIPNSCFIRFAGFGNIPYPSTSLYIDFNGPAFTSAAGNTSFYCFENFFCSPNTGAAYTLTQLIADSGTCVHGEFHNLVLNAFPAKAMNFAYDFMCSFKHILVQACSDYGITTGGGVGCYFERVTCDHTVAGGLNLTGAGFTLNDCYWEDCSQDNNPAGANASWSDLLLSGGNFTITGGSISASPTNNKAPIKLDHAAFVTFVGFVPYQLGTGAPAYVNLTANDSSAVIIGNPALTVTGTTTNVTYIKSGYGTTPPDFVMGGGSVRNSLVKVWAVATGSTGALLQGNGGVAVTRTAVGTFTLTFPTTTFSNTNYAVQICSDSPNVVSYRYNTKALGSVQIIFNNASTSALQDPYEFSAEIVGI